MTFEIMKFLPNITRELEESPEFQKKIDSEKIKFDGYYLDHKKEVSGAVFREKDVEKFVRKHKIDPIKEERDFENLSDIFARNARNYYVIDVNFEHRNPKLIRENYRRYKVYRINS